MYCPKCNKENPDDAQFCKSCGSKLTGASPAPKDVNIKTSRLAIVSLVLGILSFFVFPPMAILRQGLISIISTIIPGSAVPVSIICMIIPISAVVLGIISLVQIELSAGKAVGRAFASIGIAIPVVRFFLTVLLVCLYKPRSVAFRMVCGTNLAGMGKAMLIYSNDYEDKFPRAGGESSVWTAKIPDWKAGNRLGAYNLNNDGSGGQVSISSSFYLLVKYAEAKPKSFLCNGDPKTKEFKTAQYGAADRKLTDLWDFGPEPCKHYSFSYHNPYGQYALTTSSEPALAVSADRNPWMASPFTKAKRNFNKFDPDGGRESVNVGNAFAHKEDGQNVLFLDSHVGFEKRSFCGIKDDNIYTYWDGGDIRRGTTPKLGSQPADKLDSLLVHDPPVTDRK